MSSVNKSELYSLYGGDIREIPAYNILQASRYLKIPFETLRGWVRGRTRVDDKGNRRFVEPVIKLPDRERPSLSFVNLIEAHVLDGMRRQYGVPFKRIKSGLEFLEEKQPSMHPLADWLFQTDGVDLFIEHLHSYLNISSQGQLVMKHVMGAFLHRIDRSVDGTPTRLYPFIKKPERISDQELNKLEQQSRSVVINPLISFGKPILVGTGIPTAIIAERFQAGDSIEILAEDYNLAPEQIQKAIRYENEAPASKAA
ncbi:MAG: hypothetical protein QOF02_851 [Blastocatellia bacterium]|jgi:uncharacterized protein (DUF433 family)|nr:hypothetical protein [Blastocatellia bacterium]